MRKVGKVSFELELPPSTRVHAVFHASTLKPYHGDLGGVASNNSPRPPVGDTPSVEQVIVKILDHRNCLPTKIQGLLQILGQMVGSDTGLAGLGA